MGSGYHKIKGVGECYLGQETKLLLFENCGKLTFEQNKQVFSLFEVEDTSI